MVTQQRFNGTAIGCDSGWRLNHQATWSVAIGFEGFEQGSKGFGIRTTVNLQRQKSSGKIGSDQQRCWRKGNTLRKGKVVNWEPKAAPTLRYWIVKLKEIQSSFGDIWEFVETFQEDVSSTQISVRLNAIDDLWEWFGDVLIEIKSHEDFTAGDEIYDKERKEFSDRFYHAKSFLIEKAKERQDSAEVNLTIRSEPGHMANVDHVRLPQIKLQSFDGNIDEWLGFRDLYLSLIHWKQELPEVEKFHYLKGCLQGEPKALIDPLQITKTNYTVAWEMLLKRYNNSKQLKKRQVQALFKLPGMVKESKGELQTLLEGFERIVNTLDQVLETDEYKDLLLVNFLVSRLDSVTRRSWEEESGTKEQDSLAELTEFLHRRVRVLEALPPRFTDNRPMQPQGSVKQKTVSVRTDHNNVKSSGLRCHACKESHLLHQCQKFLRMGVNERDSLLKVQSLCRNCFRSGHMAKDCQSKFWCRTCKGRHHTLVCFKVKEDSQPAELRSSVPSTLSGGASKESSTFQTSHSSSACLTSSDQRRPRSQVLLATAVVFIEDEMGARIPARALLDSGSESNFISERLCQLMKISRKKVDISILGIGQVQTRVKHKIEAVVHSRVTKFSKEMNFLILPKVTVDLPTSSVDTDGWRIPDGIRLADPSFFVSTKVDLVLGIEFFFEFFQTGKNMCIGDNLPTLTDSVFGWVVSGGLSEHTVTRVNCNTSTTESLESLVSRFWACEEIGLEKLYTEEEQMCEDHFQKTVLRNSDGRYTVALPKKPQSFPTLGESREIAFRRLQATERRLNRDSDLRNQYIAFMEEYIELGHMQKVEENLLVKRCFLPHHPVLKESSTTTKLRVVFDASCKTSSGTSLNDGLLAGPVIQEDLRSIILRCHTKQVMVVADVEKMFRQIFITPADRPLQSILWRKSLSDEVAVYELNTVTYGTKPAPFLATRTLKQLAIDEEERYPLAAKAFTEDTYMDDVITGAEDVEAALKLRLQLENAAIAGGFRLRKFASNCPRILEGMTEENVAIKDFSEDAESDPSMKILGLTWLPKSDIFKYQFSFPELSTSGALTKRQVLSVIATLFDPLGLLGAAITTAKVFMQQLWLLQDSNQERLGWDQPLPPTFVCDRLPTTDQERSSSPISTDSAVLMNIITAQAAGEVYSDRIVPGLVSRTPFLDYTTRTILTVAIATGSITVCWLLVKGSFCRLCCLLYCHGTGLVSTQRNLQADILRQLVVWQNQNDRAVGHLVVTAHTVVRGEFNGGSGQPSSVCEHRRLEFPDKFVCDRLPTTDQERSSSPISTDSAVLMNIITAQAAGEVYSDRIVPGLVSRTP
ncbi:uncharacterized protein LOC129759772 [Uranotaenia lowii]|uniref:uncharacterized protein LOC129759772 n=1 Tax=Uranotaenia lowii TaxID=190385 RepID=UPI002479EC96|nr:uncharacterized protein LOC129759772 [Uranotaenia lowii]